jgi:hypothetical protein
VPRCEPIPIVPIDASRPDEAALLRFLYYQLSKARAEAVQADWEDYYWSYVGDVEIMSDDAADAEDFTRRFEWMLDEKSGIRELWEKSGLTIADLFKDELDSAADSEAKQ